MFHGVSHRESAHPPGGGVAHPLSRRSTSTQPPISGWAAASSLKEGYRSSGCSTYSTQPINDMLCHRAAGEPAQHILPAADLWVGSRQLTEGEVQVIRLQHLQLTTDT